MNDDETRERDRRSRRAASDDFATALSGAKAILSSLPRTRETRRLARALDTASDVSTTLIFDTDNRHTPVLALLSTDRLREGERVLKDFATRYHDPANLARTSTDFFAWIRSAIDELLQQPSFADPAEASIRLRLRQLDAALAAIQAVEEVEGAAAEVAETVQSAKEATGSAAESALAGDFGAFASRQGWISVAWSVLALLALVSSALLVWLILPGLGADIRIEQLGRLAITIPLFALAVYAARVAGHHRSAAQWAAIHAVQLKTISAYVETLQPEQRATLRYEFGRRIFATPGPDGEASSPGLVDPGELIDKVTNLVKASADTARAARS